MTESDRILEIYGELDTLIEEKTVGPDSDFAKNHVVAIGAITECIKETVRKVLPHTAAFPGANDIDYSRFGISTLNDMISVNRYSRFIFQKILDESV